MMESIYRCVWLNRGEYGRFIVALLTLTALGFVLTTLLVGALYGVV